MIDACINEESISVTINDMQILQLQILHLKGIWLTSIESNKDSELIPINTKYYSDPQDVIPEIYSQPFNSLFLLQTNIDLTNDIKSKLEEISKTTIHTDLTAYKTILLKRATCIWISDNNSHLQLLVGETEQQRPMLQGTLQEKVTCTVNTFDVQ